MSCFGPLIYLPRSPFKPLPTLEVWTNFSFLSRQEQKVFFRSLNPGFIREQWRCQLRSQEVETIWRSMLDDWRSKYRRNLLSSFIVLLLFPRGTPLFKHERNPLISMSDSCRTESRWDYIFSRNQWHSKYSFPAFYLRELWYQSTWVDPTLSLGKHPAPPFRCARDSPAYVTARSHLPVTDDVIFRLCRPCSHPFSHRQLLQTEAELYAAHPSHKSTTEREPASKVRSRASNVFKRSTKDQTHKRRRPATVLRITTTRKEAISRYACSP